MLGLFKLLPIILQVLAAFIHLPTGVSPNATRGIGDFLLKGIWKALGLPNPADGIADFVKALLAKFGGLPALDSASVRQFVLKILEQLGTVSAQTPIKLDDYALQALASLVKNDVVWQTIYAYIVAGLNGTPPAATLADTLSGEALAAGFDWSRLAPLLEQVIALIVALFTHASPQPLPVPVPVPTPTPAVDPTPSDKSDVSIG